METGNHHPTQVPRGLVELLLAQSPPLSLVFPAPAPNLCGMIKPEAFLRHRSQQDQPGAGMTSPPPRARGVPWQCPLCASPWAGPGTG